MDVDAYLQRIGVAAGPPSLERLRELHLAHLRSVPFENLDIARGVPLSLESQDLFDKIVRRRRGGFCYELNGLFADLLGELGYPVDRLSARVFDDDGVEGPAFDHMILLVRLEGEWLCDVGFGDSFLEPLRWSFDEQPQGNRVYQLEPFEDRFRLRGRQGRAKWEAMMTLDRQPRALAEFEPMFLFHQSSPESPFTRKTVCTRATPEGRVTLSNGRGILSTGSGQTRRDLDENQQTAFLRQHFGVDLSIQ